MARSPDPSITPTVDPRVLRTRNDVLKAAIEVLIDEGWEAVTHQHIAQVAGYSKATVYAHWPARADLMRDAFTYFGDVPHHTPTGDLRTDLVEEVTSFRSAMVDQRLDRALAVLVDLTASVPELVEVRDKLVADGERIVRALLEPVLDGAELEAATLMLCGAVLHGALMHGRPPGDDVIESAVDLTLRGLGRSSSPLEDS
jgi:AcrR family transcriptional regulator